MIKYHMPRKRRGTAAILGAVIMFAMLFTVGTGYFIFVTNEQIAYTQTYVNRANQLQSVINENAIITTLLTSGHISFYVNNTGGLNLNITAAFVLDSSGNVLKCEGKGVPTGQSCYSSNTAFPIVMNAGKGSATIDTGYTYVSPNTNTIKLVSARGSVFTATYPATAVPLAQLAITTQGSGFLSLDFNSYLAYNTTGSGAGCNPTAASCQLTPWSGSSGGISGFTLWNAGKTGRFYVFSITVTDVDPQKRTITLDSNSRVIQYLAPAAGSGGGTASAWPWQIGVVSGSGVTQSWSTITITYGQTTTLFFTAVPSGSGAFNANKFPGSAIYVGVFIYLHGTLGSSAYGQNIPFVTTLYN